MNKTKQLLKSYTDYLSVPWRHDIAAAQRVIFCVYDENTERQLRAGLDEFEIVTQERGHKWLLFDLTNTFAVWMASQRYAKSYFQKPHLLSTVLENYLAFLAKEFASFLEVHNANENTVIALKGVGSLFGFVKVKDVIEAMAPLVKGRLVVFFPGSCEGNNYRLLDAYDGWNYLAIPLTVNKG